MMIYIMCLASWPACSKCSANILSTYSLENLSGFQTRAMNTLHFNDTAFQLNTIIQQLLCAGPHDGKVGRGEGRELCSAPWEVLVMLNIWHVLTLGVVHFSKGRSS